MNETFRIILMDNNLKTVTNLMTKSRISENIEGGDFHCKRD